MGFFGPLFLPAINHALARAGWAQQKLVPFSGRRARILVGQWQLDFAIGVGGLLDDFPKGGTEPFDVEISLASDTAFISLLRGPSELMRCARVSGSAEFAEALGFVISRIRWDLEEDLANWVGDIPARRLYGLGGSFFAWQKQSAQRAAENLSEYLTEESQYLAKANLTSRFVSDIDMLRDGVARLEKRIQRLE